MPFADSFPIRARGPRTDLCIAYVHADIGASGEPTIDAAKTSSGCSITRSTTGTYSLTFPKCRFCLPMGTVRPASLTTEADAVQVFVAPNLDATSGAVAFVTGDEADTDVDPADGSEIVFMILMGY